MRVSVSVLSDAEAEAESRNAAVQAGSGNCRSGEEGEDNWQLKAAGEGL
jgi:hypothetical protein